jgi:hypothetical protein
MAVDLVQGTEILSNTVTDSASQPVIMPDPVGIRPRFLVASSMVTSFDILPFVQKPVAERVKALREEIADIRESNRIAVGRRNAAAAAEQERRLQRLLEIVDELAALTDWKKL